MSSLLSYPSSGQQTTPIPGSHPPTLPVCFDTIPPELIARPQWVVWRWEWDSANQKWKKPPFDPRTNTRASHSDSATWATFDTAIAAYQAGGYDGIGFVFSTKDVFCGVDLDNCRNIATGEIKPWAMRIIHRLNSYTEISPSGTGVKIFLCGNLPPGGRVQKIKDGKIELYDSSRYFTVTGYRLEALPPTPMERQSAIDQLHQELFSQPVSTTQAAIHHSTSSQFSSTTIVLSDDQVIQFILSKRRDQSLWTGRPTLWSGKKPRFSSQSEADAALVAKLARMTQDASQIDRLFRQSGLMRPKWDEPHYANGATYGAWLINKTLASNSPLMIEFCRPPGGHHIHHDDYFAKLRLSRAAMPARRELMIDRSPCGVGKSVASLHSYSFYEKTLTVCPTHENCEAYVNRGVQLGFDIRSRPKLAPSNCENFEKANTAQQSGLSFEEAVCPDCPLKHRCSRNGYRKEVRLFKQAKHQVITHERAMRARLDVLSQDKSLVVIQEKALDLLRDSSAVAFARLDELRSAFTEVSQRYSDPQLASYARALLQTIRYLQSSSQYPFVFQIQKPALPCLSPDGWHKAVYDVMIQTEVNIDSDAIQGIMSYAAGRAEAFYRPEKSGKGGHPKQIVFARKNSFPEGIPIVVEDSHASVDWLRRASNRPLRDWKSIADPEALHRVVQIPRDYKKETSSRKVVDQVRGVLLARPNATRVGIITHRDHVDAIDQIEQPFRDRIEMIDYFWSGNTRASNKWYQRCDLLIIIGTPRPGEAAVQEFLLRHDYLAAAQTPDRLTEAIALGTTESGQQRAFWTLSHQNTDWKEAYRQLVVAEIMQAVGRARFIRPDGIPETLVFSNEVLELPLADDDISPVSVKVSDLYSVLVSNTTGIKPVQSPTSHRGGGCIANRVQRGGARKVLSIYRIFRAPVNGSALLPAQGIGYKRLARLTKRPESTIRDQLTILRDAKLIAKCPDGGEWPV